jgi:outer membrane protein assembly factor BamB
MFVGWAIACSAVGVGLAGIGAAGVASAAEAWTQFRGPGGQGISTEKGLPTTWSPTENVAWKTELPGAGTSSPILVGDKIYLTCFSGFGVPGQRGEMDDLKRHLVCLDRKSGKLLWKNDIPAKLPEQERIRDDHGFASSTPASNCGRRMSAMGSMAGARPLRPCCMKTWC